MQKLQNGGEVIKDTIFTPWNDERQIELIAINSLSYSPTKQAKSVENSPRANDNLKQPYLASVQKDKIKILLSVEQQENKKRMQLLKYFADRKKENPQKIDDGLPQGLNVVKLPSINKRKQTLNAKQRHKKILQKNMDQFIISPIQADTEEQHIFRKYGEHKKRQVLINERSWSLGYQPIKITSRKNELQLKYATLESPNVRQNRKSQKMFSDLKLKGKKYSYQTRSDKSHSIDSASPAESRITTPRNELFGHTKEDILKRVLKQLHQKFKKDK